MCLDTNVMIPLVENINPGRESTLTRWIIPAAMEHLINFYMSLLKHWDLIIELKLEHAVYGNVSEYMYIL